MSFLAPLYALGLLAVSLPILFHLIRRTPRGRLPFSSLMFLKASPPTLTKRSRIENWLLLLLRAAIVCLLAFAFARPYLRETSLLDSPAKVGKQLVLVIDTSASMQRENLWTQALEQAKQLIETVQPEDQLAIIKVGQTPQVLLSFEEWGKTIPKARQTLAQEQIERLQPTWEATQLGKSLSYAADLLREATLEQEQPNETQLQHIHLISDLQSGSQLDELQAYDWPAKVQLHLSPVEAVSPNNAGIQLVANSIVDQVWDQEPVIRVRIANASGAKKETFQLKWKTSELDEVQQQKKLQTENKEQTNEESESNIEKTEVKKTKAEDANRTTLNVYVPAGESRVFVAPKLPANQTTGELILSGDDHPFDNSAYYVARQPEQLSVAYLGEEAADDTSQLLYYLKHALLPTPTRVVEMVTLDEFDSTDVESQTYSLIVTREKFSASIRHALQTYLKQGGTVLTVLTKSPDAEKSASTSLAELLDVKELSIQEAATNDYSMLTDIDYQHPLFAPLADPRYGDFTKIRFWKHRQLLASQLPGGKVLAKFDDGSPALVEKKIGTGKLYLLTAGWHPSDSQLFRSSKFVLLMNLLLEQSSQGTSNQTQYHVADEIPLSSQLLESKNNVTVQDPKEIHHQLPSSATSFEKTTQPGIYQINSDAITNSVTKSVAVNLAADESKTAPIAGETFESYRIPLAKNASTLSIETEQLNHRQLRERELEKEQKLWRWLILVAVVLLLFETWLAGWYSRRIQQSSAITT